MEVEIKHKYIAILRCRTWCDWPEWSRFISRAYQEPLNIPHDDGLFLSAHIVTYARRQRPEAEPARSLQSDAGPIVWRGQMEAGYWLGLHFVKAPEDKLMVALHYEPPYEGEIDIQLHMGLVSVPSMEELTQLASRICTSILAFINLALGELAVPVAPVQVRELRENGAQFASSIIMAVRDRPPVTPELAQHTADRFVEARSGMSEHEAHALSIAARRYLTSLTETDPVDKYCDLWESCEFSTMYTRAKGGKVGRIAEALGAHLKRSGVNVAKADVERTLQLKTLYETRGSIVHEAMESPQEFTKKTKLLEAVASELLRYCFGLPCLRQGPIPEKFPSAFA
jgi:hypothetical protein